MINALHLTGRKLADIKVVVNGAGAAGIACLELLKSMGLPNDNAILCDTKGVVYRGRTEGMNQWKSAHAVETKARTLAEALKGSDVFLGLSAKGAMTAGDGQDRWRKAPIIFAMANPDPEITPEEAKAVRPDAIVATGRSDYPNQVNNVLGFPYIFRGALDVRATHHQRRDEDRRRRSHRRAGARGCARRSGGGLSRRAARSMAPTTSSPSPFDPRLISRVSPRGGGSGHEDRAWRGARSRISTPISFQLSARLDPSAALFQTHHRQRARQAQARGVCGRRRRIA